MQHQSLMLSLDLFYFFQLHFLGQLTDDDISGCECSLPATTAWSLSMLVKSASARFILSPLFLPSELISVCSDSLISDFFLRSFDVKRFSVVSLPARSPVNQSINQSLTYAATSDNSVQQTQ